MDEDMLAIPLTEVMEGIKQIEGANVPLEDCVLVLPREGGETKFYIMRKKDLWQ